MRTEHGPANRNKSKNREKVHTMYHKHCFEPHKIVFLTTAYGVKNVLTVTINHLFCLTFNACWLVSHNKKNINGGIFFPSVYTKVPLIHVFGVKAPNGIFATRENVSEGGGLVPNGFRQRRRALLFAAVSWMSDRANIKQQAPLIRARSVSAELSCNYWSKTRAIPFHFEDKRHLLLLHVYILCTCDAQRIRGIKSLNPASRLNCHSSKVKAPLLNTHAGSFCEDNTKTKR